MQEQQLMFETAQAGESQSAKILHHLQQCRGREVSLPNLVRISGGFAVHSRIADLRREGHPIINRVDRTTKPFKSYYQIS